MPASATPPARPAGAPPLPSAAPPTGARALAVLAIVVAGLCGGLIGYGIVDLQATADDPPGVDSGGGLGPLLGGLVGAVLAAVGVAVVAVLVLRAMTEWKTIEERARAEGREPPPRRNVSGRRT
jgi:hypothetical protein